MDRSAGDVRDAGRDDGPHPTTAPKFFRNYNRILGLALGLLLLVLLLMFGQQLRRDVAAEVALIEGQVARHAQLIEFALRSSVDEVETLRLAAGWSTDATGSPKACPPLAWLAHSGELRQQGLRFSRDSAADPDAGGNLVGVGRLAGADPLLACDLHAALTLNTHLRSLPFRQPNAARVRFIGAHGFLLSWPWEPADRLPSWDEAIRDSVWLLAGTAPNPHRRSFWADPYFGGAGRGLLVPVAAPVHDGERFLGVVAVDTSLDYLNRLNAGFPYPLGYSAVIDRDGRALAHPVHYADPLAVHEPIPAGQSLPSQVRGLPGGFDAAPVGRAVRAGDWLTIRQPLAAAPWQLVYTVPSRALWQRKLGERALPMAAMLVGLAGLVLLAHAMAAREFVRPAARLVEHVVAESAMHPRPVPPVPAPWRPWFEAISRAFGQSLQLSQLRQELEIAARMQQSILPRQWPQDPRFVLWGAMDPAREVGGDFYDHFPLSGDTHALVVADVSGKGIAAGLFAMVSKTLLRTLATREFGDLASTVAQVNDALAQDNDDAMFVTAFLGRYAPATGWLEFVNAGHPPPLLLRADTSLQWLAGTGGCALGVMEGLAYAVARVRLAPGDLLLVFSDGVTEAQDASARPFGADGLAALLSNVDPCVGARSPQAIVERVRAAVRAFAGGVPQFDDITCLALQCVSVAEAAGDDA